MAKAAARKKRAPKSAPRKKTARRALAAIATEFAPSRFAVQAFRARGTGSPRLIDFPAARGDGSFDLADIISQQAVDEIAASNSISFHAVGDTGRGADTEQQDVAEAMQRDIDLSNHTASPAFLFHLGDIIYGPDKTGHYRDKFYRPYADYSNSILAIPGNHDADVDKLAAYFDHFCLTSPQQPPLAQEFERRMPHQPGAYWHLTAPFVDLIGLFSNSDENIGSLTSAGRRPTVQVDWLHATLKKIAQARTSGTKKALIIGTHHPPYSRGLQSSGTGHPGNPGMLAQIDDACQTAGIWPDAVLSGHSHSYQRYNRLKSVDGHQRVIPYVIAGTGGIGLQGVSANIGAQKDDVTYNAGIRAYGYLTVKVSASQLSIAFTQQFDGHRAPTNIVVVDLATGQLIG